MRAYVPESLPRIIEPQAAEWLDRNALALQNSLDTVHDLNIESAPPVRPQVGMIRYFTEEADLPYGEGPYVYHQIDVSGTPYYYWSPAWHVSLNADMENDDTPVAIASGAGWIQLSSLSIDVRFNRRLKVYGQVDVEITNKNNFVLAARVVLNSTQMGQFLDYNRSIAAGPTDWHSPISLNMLSAPQQAADVQTWTADLEVQATYTPASPATADVEEWNFTIEET